jgi:L-ascorbate metabolism protein UlaG (beta-lactamase superfamily)
MIAITWLGHSTALIELDGVRLLTDPVLGGRVGPLVRIGPKPQIGEIGTIDCVLLSHLHADHTDLGSLRAVAREVAVVGPHPSAPWLRSRGLARAQDLRPGQEMTLSGLRITAVPATHDSKRAPFGPAAEAIGYLVSGSRSVYFAGDTDLFEAMSELHGLVDVALLPVAGWGRSLGPGHLDPERAAQAAGLIGPELAIPIHWGTLTLGWPARRPADPERPAREFAAMMKQYAPGVSVRVLAPGERAEL